MLVVVAGCPSAASDDGDGDAEASDDWHEDPPEEDDDALIVGGRDAEGSFVAYAASDQATWVFGPQGGYMIEPVVSLDPAVAGDERSVQVTIDNAADPDWPAAAGELAEDDEFHQWVFEVELFAEEGRLRSEPLFNQIGWSAPEGVRFVMDVTVRGQQFAVATTRAIEVVAADDPTGCSELPMTGEGCVYRRIEGQAVIDAIADPAADDCSEQDVAFTFVPDDPAHAECYTGDGESSLRLEDGSTPSAACIAELGLQVGDAVPVIYGEIIAGTCSPWEWDLGALFEPCTGLCP